MMPNPDAQFRAFAAAAFYNSNIRVTVLIEPESTLQHAPPPPLDWRKPDCQDALSGIVHVTIETRPKSKPMPAPKPMPERMLIPSPPALDWRVVKTTK